MRLVQSLLITASFIAVLSEALASPTKRIALTLDDAPRGDGPMYSGAQRAGVLLESLKSVEAGPVAFFVTTKHLEKNDNRKRVERYANAGNLIANHTHSHPWLSRVDTDEYIAGIDKAEVLLNGFDNRRPWFRFPYLDEGSTHEKRDQVRESLAQRNLINGYVTVDNYDWYIEGKWQEAVKQGKSVDMDALRSVYLTVMLSAVDFFDELAQNTLEHSPAHVLLMHENDLAAIFIDDLITELRSKGWEIISPDEAYRDPIAKTLPKTLMANQGLVAALAVEAGTKPQALSHLAIEEKLIDELLSQHQVFGEKKAQSAMIRMSNPH